MSYRTRRLLRRALLTALWLVIIGLLLWACWMVWVQRYVVYTRDGVKIDMNRSTTDIAGEEARPPAPRDPVSIYFTPKEEITEMGAKLYQILGYYVPTDALLYDISAVSTQLDLLAPGSAVMLDLKSIYGNFFYSTKINGASVAESINTKMVDNIIKKLTAGDYYTIARVPAFREMNFDTDACLSDEDGYPWHDEEYCVWLDPTNGQTMAYLIQICNEFRNLGFDEVVFCEFRFPDSSNYVFDSDLTKPQALAETAAALVSTCTAEGFAVSFEGDSSFVLPAGQSRLYLDGITAEQAASVAATIPVTDPVANIVFKAISNDTRYNAFSALRVMDVGQNSSEE